MRADPRGRVEPPDPTAAAGGAGDRPGRRAPRGLQRLLGLLLSRRERLHGC